MLRLLLLGFASVLFLRDAVDCAMSETQLKAAFKLVRNVCQPKTKVTNEQIDAMHKGDWNLDKPAQCYMWCVLNSYHLVTKDNDFDWEAAVKTLTDLAPESVRVPGIISTKNCKDCVKTKSDKCAAGFEIAKCIYQDDPPHYFLP